MKRSTLALAAAVAFGVTGCATTSNPESMTPIESVSGVRHAETVSVKVTGKPSSNSHTTSDAFRQAVVAAIEENETFSAVVRGNRGDYRLTIQLVDVDTPSFGLSATVNINALWSLEKADGTVVMLESVQSSGTVGAFEAFAGWVRSRMASEAAARNNIAAGLAKISKLNF